MYYKVDDIGIAKLDLDRKQRTGITETIFCQGKSKEHLLKIFSEFNRLSCSVLGTRCSEVQYDFLSKNDLDLSYDPVSHVVILNKDNKINNLSLNGAIAVCSGGTSDMFVSEEASLVAEFLGAKVGRFYDIGVAGLHRLLDKIDEIREYDVIICVAGMEGALASVVAGLVQAPVIAVPTSVGYGASFSGLAPLLTMVNSCAEGISVVNIDNGFGAAVQACRILRLKGK